MHFVTLAGAEEEVFKTGADASIDYNIVGDKKGLKYLGGSNENKKEGSEVVIDLGADIVSKALGLGIKNSGTSEIESKAAEYLFMLPTNAATQTIKTGKTE